MLPVEIFRPTLTKLVGVLRRILDRATSEDATLVRRGAAERNLLGLLEEILSEPELE